MTQRHGQNFFYGPPPRLRRPPRKPGSVIGKINPNPQLGVLIHADLLQAEDF